MAVRFVSNTPLGEVSKTGITYETVEKIPGKLGDRRTPLGELNWIFTAITDTIAWNVLPRGMLTR
jgi:regulator-associated protein of mTOR